ncbi:hypothetical protein [uncultured Desulfovibrio sp.]|uniref:hypothetical protein n=1 Tax=uncultured Desulfovibrio sp. TaxID=167968 RepID=UPI002606C52A|nr:hypothetical protein [uncultured Desulfovibrio sp.]
MSAFDNNGADRAAEYLGIARGLWPLALISGGVALACGMRRIKRGYLQRTPLQILANLLLSSCVASILAVCCVLLAPLLLDQVSPSIELGLAVFVGVGGVKAFDALMRWKAGLRIVDLMDPEDINDLRLRMSPEDRRRHAEQCPFRADECRPDGRE